MKAFFKNLFVFVVAPIVVAAILVITIGSQFGSAWFLLLVLFGLGIVFNIPISKFMTNTIYTIVMIGLIMSTVGSWGLTKLGDTFMITKYVMPEAIQGKDLKIAAKIDEPLVDAKQIIFMDQREREKKIANEVAKLVKDDKQDEAIDKVRNMSAKRAKVDELINPTKHVASGVKNVHKPDIVLAKGQNLSYMLAANEGKSVWIFVPGNIGIDIETKGDIPFRVNFDDDTYEDIKVNTKMPKMSGRTIMVSNICNFQTEVKIKGR